MRPTVANFKQYLRHYTGLGRFIHVYDVLFMFTTITYFIFPLFFFYQYYKHFIGVIDVVYIL